MLIRCRLSYSSKVLLRQHQHPLNKSYISKTRCYSKGAGRESIIGKLWNSYTSALKRRPLVTKTTAAALIFFTSDSATQFITSSEEKFRWDATRAASGAIFGVAGTCFLHVWWNILERMVESRLPVARYRLANTMVKVVVDQAWAAPFYIYCYYIITNSIQKQQESPDMPLPSVLQVTKEKADAVLLPTMLRHWRVWPLVHSINFYFVPLQHRVLVQNVVLVGWSGCKLPVRPWKDPVST